MQRIGRLQNTIALIYLYLDAMERDHVGIHHGKNLIELNCLQQIINYFLGFYGCTPGAH
jgi:hypothetical protein